MPANPTTAKGSKDFAKAAQGHQDKARIGIAKKKQLNDQ